MIRTTESFAETTVRRSTDLLEDALAPLRIGGLVLLRETYSSPWAIDIPDHKGWNKLVAVPSGARAVPFHLVEKGQCKIKTRQGETLLLRAGELAICFGGDAHTLSVGRATTARSIATLLGDRAEALSTNKIKSAPATSLFCGVFFLHQTQQNPLFSSLPMVTKVEATDARSTAELNGVVKLLRNKIEHRQAGGDYIVSRLLEILCAEAIRIHVGKSKLVEPGWLRGIADPLINRAIAMIHGNPGHKWSVEYLARHLSLSPSRFAARFVEVLEESPMAYVVRWRILMAQQYLTTSPLGIDQIAAKTGYESVAAFNRAFKRVVGTAPAQWRASKLQQEQK